MSARDFELDIAQIIKAIAYWEIRIEKLRIQIAENPNFDIQIAWSKLAKNDPSAQEVNIKDFIEFLQVNRIALSEREAEILISSKCNSTTDLDFDGFRNALLPQTNMDLHNYALNKRKIEQNYLKKVFQNKEAVLTFSQQAAAEIFSEELLAYREVEGLREEFARSYGVTATQVYRTVDFKERGVIDQQCLSEFMQSIGVRFHEHEFYAFIARTTVDRDQKLDYQELINAIMPKEPYAYPAFRQEEFSVANSKERILHKAQHYGVPLPTAALDTAPPPHEQDPFDQTFPVRRVYDPYQFRRPTYLCDKAYMSQLKEYNKLFYRPNKDQSFQYKAEGKRGLRYHDSFFDGYYKHLHERDLGEGFFNKFGKRYAYEDEIQQLKKGSKANINTLVSLGVVVDSNASNSRLA